MKTKTGNPICPCDKAECYPDMDGYIRCRTFERFKPNIWPKRIKENSERINTNLINE